MSINTVNGPVCRDQLGIVAPHEHIFIDIRNQFSEFSDALMQQRSKQKVSLEHLDILRRNPYALKDNLVLNDFDLAAEELDYFVKAGGNTIVDVTLRNIGRDVKALKKLAELTGLNIVTCTGYYTEDTHPENMVRRTVSGLAQEMIEELTIGIDGTDICAGIIGEMGTGIEITGQEEKALRAAAVASGYTGAPIMVHIYPWGNNGLEALNIIDAEGISTSRVCICHSDVELDEMYIRCILNRGAYLEFDDFGKEFAIDKGNGGFANSGFARDIERARLMVKLTEDGYASQLLFSCDICLKTLLHRFGGWGYDHCISNVTSMLKGCGMADKHLQMILKDNPANYLDIVNQQR